MEQKFNEALIKRINDLKVPEDLKNLKFRAIPFGKSVYIQETANGERKTKSGLIVSSGKLSQGTVGFIIAVGPEVYPYLNLIGKKVLYNVHANLEIIIDGEPYLMMHELDIYSVLDDSDEEIQVNMAPPSKKQQRLEVKRKEQVEVFKRVRAKEKNDEDKYEELAKKTIKKSPRKPLKK